MSQMPALARPSARVTRRPEATRPQLRVVPTAPRAPRRLPFVLLCSFLLAAGLMTLLFLNMQLAQGSYALHSLQSQSTQLEEDAGALRESLAAESAPAQLASKALALGMVPGAAPAFLRLPDGQVLGVPQPAPAGVSTGASASPSPSSSTSPSASSSASSSPSAAATPSSSSSATPSSSPRSPSATASAGPSASASASAGR